MITIQPWSRCREIINEKRVGHHIKKKYSNLVKSYSKSVSKLKQKKTHTYWGVMNKSADVDRRPVENLSLVDVLRFSSGQCRPD